MARRERDILEHAVRTIAEQAAKADDIVDEAKAAGGGDHPVTVHAKMLRLELLKVKADLERELEDFSLNCSRCGLDVHWVSGLGVSPGHWAHREPAPHGEPGGVGATSARFRDIDKRTPRLSRPERCAVGWLNHAGGGRRSPPGSCR
jgi:hypothetical protein